MRALVQTVYFGRQFLNAVGQGQEDDPKAMVEVEELVREIAQALVDEPDAVEVESVGREENTVLKLRVAPTDVGKVIGKQGRTARSMRTILGAVSMKLHHRYTLDILEEDED
ncbi:MAG: KH domain-containing protein [Terracidiphilus sp.]